MKLMYKIWLDNNGKAFGRGPYQLLLGIKNTGSLAQAAKAMNMSYSHAHLLMKSLSNNLGFPLLESQAGGVGGGGTVITKQGEQLLKNYNAFCNECDEVIATTFLKYFPGSKEDIIKLNLLDQMSPLETLLLKEREVITLVGGGGKTSIMYALADMLAKKKKKVIITTTTKIFVPSPNRIGLLIISEEADLMKELEDSSEDCGVLAIGTGIFGNKLGSVSPEFVDELSDRHLADYIIIEADGAARKPFKAPKKYEPVIPLSSTLVLAIVGLDALGKELKLENVHRVEEISALTGLKEGAVINEDVIATVLVNSNGGRKNVPGSARWLPVINKVDDLNDLLQAEKIAKALFKKGEQEVIFSSVHDNILDIKKWEKIDGR